MAVVPITERVIDLEEHIESMLASHGWVAAVVDEVDEAGAADWMIKYTLRTLEREDYRWKIELALYEVGNDLELLPPTATTEIIVYNSQINQSRGFIDRAGESDAVEAVSTLISAIDSPVADGPLDQGSRLLDPITGAELGGVEEIVGELWEAAGSGRLSEEQHLMIRTIAEQLDHHRMEPETVTDGTRGRTVWTTGSALKWLAFVSKDLPQGVIAWAVIVQTLLKINWPTVARAIEQSLRAGP